MAKKGMEKQGYEKWVGYDINVSFFDTKGKRRNRRFNFITFDNNGITLQHLEGKEDGLVVFKPWQQIIEINGD